nr:DPP IV N-terminal domain-containing protein [uncultured Carboxylicivirga sp.]
MHVKDRYLIGLMSIIITCGNIFAQTNDASLLTLDRIYNSGEFRMDYLQPIQWNDDGNSYVRVENNQQGLQELVRYNTANSKREVIINNEDLIPDGRSKSVYVESFSFSPDKSKVLIFTNSSRVWRANTKGDYWVYDFKTKALEQIGKSFPSSSLMFAKFSADQSKIAFVQDFNLYVEDLHSREVSALTHDKEEGIINGTFDWVYEEEFGDRDGFKWSPKGDQIAFWHLDASNTGTFYMINNTDSIYSKPIPIKYPKVGQDPSACKVGICGVSDKKVTWIPLEGSEIQNYIPAMQWINNDELLIQQLNRHQNKLIVWLYNKNSGNLKKVYTETEDTWVDIQYPDVSSNNWGKNDLMLVDANKSFLRLSETDGWRHIYKVNIKTGEKTLLTPGEYDVASMLITTPTEVYFHASPDNSAQRYLYKIDLKGSGKLIRVTPKDISGVNIYNISPNGKYAIFNHQSAMQATQTSIVSLPKHKILNTLVSNDAFAKKLASLQLPEVEFFTVTTEEGIDVDGRMIKPVNFDPNHKYPVLFHVYGEPWGQVGSDTWIGMWNIFLAQQGYVVIDMDNRGTPCLKGSEWRKCIYRNVGITNTRDQALAAKEVLKKMTFIDPDRTAVWGWSGGGSMTLNLMFQYPDIYKTGMAVAAVSNQLIYDNIYQERYMGLPQENMDDFVKGSPITYAKNLEGNLLVVHGTGDDNVHYQSMEMLVNELILNNKQFQMMAYPNRSHGIYEGQNTRRHLYTLLTNYLMIHVPANK